jgi:uncharacterized protein YdeI (YjbR/CyaY-like superfamily)
VTLLEFLDAAAWESWLAEHHADASEAWLRIAKRGSGNATIAIAAALAVALCWGWIDGQRKGLDEASFSQRYCPRRPRSSWSQINVAKVEVLTAAGRMRPPGLAEVAAAQADGRWAAAYASQRTAEVPPDLATALAANPRAAAAFAGLGRSERYQVILALLKTQTASGRKRALARAIERLEG